MVEILNLFDPISCVFGKIRSILDTSDLSCQWYAPAQEVYQKPCLSKLCAVFPEIVHVAGSQHLYYLCMELNIFFSILLFTRTFLLKPPNIITIWSISTVNQIILIVTFKHCGNLKWWDEKVQVKLLECLKLLFWMFSWYKVCLFPARKNVVTEPLLFVFFCQHAHTTLRKMVTCLPFKGPLKLLNFEDTRLEEFNQSSQTNLLQKTMKELTGSACIYLLQAPMAWYSSWLDGQDKCTNSSA